MYVLMDVRGTPTSVYNLLSVYHSNLGRNSIHGSHPADLQCWYGTEYDSVCLKKTLARLACWEDLGLG